MTSEVEIGVWVEGVQKWVTGVTRRTTCHDVIKALLRAQQNARIDDSDVNHYVIVERWRKVERPLEHEQRILKVWRTWGEAVGEVRFSLRRVRDGETCLSSGGGSSVGRPERSRRRHKWRHAHHNPKETVHPKKLAREDPKFCETMERLMRLVVAQGETIQTQLRRLQEREHQIEQYEQQMHLLRVQNLGTDYLLHSYLKDEQGEVKDEPGSEEKSNDSGVVTEEAVEGMAQEEETTAASGTDEMEEITRLLTKIEQMNTRLLHEEEALAGMLSAVEAADEQQKDEAEILQQELACVALAHAQLVSNVRQNEITLREMETVLWRQRKELEELLREDTESDMETRALQQHLNYIIHLPPTAFRLPEEETPEVKKTIPPPPPPAATNAAAPARVPPVSTTKSATSGSSNLVSILKNSNTKNVIWEEDEEDDLPPPLPSCPPPVLDDEDDGDSANNSSLCVSSRSSTSSEASTSSSSGISSKEPDSSAPSKSSSSSSSLKSSLKTTERSGKDTDSTDSNSDTGLSSLHSSSDEGVYVLDTLV